MNKYKNPNYQAEYKAKNKERLTEYRKKYAAKNKEALAIVRKIYNDLTKDQKRTYNKLYRESKKEDTMRVNGINNSDFHFKFKSPTIEFINNNEKIKSTRLDMLKFLHKSGIQLSRDMRSVTINKDTVYIEFRNGSSKEILVNV